MSNEISSSEAEKEKFREILHRKGRFMITWAAIQTMPARILEIMARVIVIRAEYMGIMHAIEYHALSPEFDITKEGDPLPLYQFELTKSAEGEFSGRFIREESFQEEGKGGPERLNKPP